MAEHLDKIDISINDTLSQLENFKQNSQRLQLEAFKIENILTMFNNCADRCQLQYKESGIRAAKGGQVSEEVRCFTNCIEKSYRVSQFAFNQQ